MSSFYLPADLSKYVNAMGGKTYLEKIVRANMNSTARLVCPKCKRTLKRDGLICWNCGFDLGA